MTDAVGKPVPMMPSADLQASISAAMAEIIAKMAVSYDPASSHALPSLPATSACCCRQPYRVLRQSPRRGKPGGPNSVSAIDAPRLTEARDKLVEIVGYFNRRLEWLDRRRESRAMSAWRTLPAELARRAVKVLQALASRPS